MPRESLDEIKDDAAREWKSRSKELHRQVPRVIGGHLKRENERIMTVVNLLAVYGLTRIFLIKFKLQRIRLSQLYKLFQIISNNHHSPVLTCHILFTYSILQYIGVNPGG